MKREIAQLPKHIAEIEKQLTSHRRRLEADQAALAANQKERRALDGEIKIFEEKISKLKNQMLDAKTNEQYRAFQHEITFAEDGIHKAEDRILDLMEKSEPLAEAVAKAEADLKEERKQVDLEADAARERSAVDRRELEKRAAVRNGLAGELNPKILANYERIRKRYGLPVIAEATNGKCSACNMSLRPQFMQDLRHAEEPVRCENCTRLLYYHPTVDVEAQQSSGGEPVNPPSAQSA